MRRQLVGELIVPRDRIGDTGPFLFFNDQVISLLRGHVSFSPTQVVSEISEASQSRAFSRRRDALTEIGLSFSCWSVVRC